MRGLAARCYGLEVLPQDQAGGQGCCCVKVSFDVLGAQFDRRQRHQEGAAYHIQEGDHASAAEVGRDVTTYGPFVL